MESRPVRRVRAFSVGGSQYDAVNSGNVVRTDKATGKKTTITGSDMHTALDQGVKAKHSRALTLQRQIDAHSTDHHPMGCAEARAETAIAAHHLSKPFSALPVSSKTSDGWTKSKSAFETEKKQAKQTAVKKHVDSGWNNSSKSVYSATKNESDKIIPPCDNCGRRGHTTSGRGHV